MDDDVRIHLKQIADMTDAGLYGDTARQARLQSSNQDFGEWAVKRAAPYSSTLSATTTGCACTHVSDTKPRRRSRQNGTQPRRLLWTHSHAKTSSQYSINPCPLYRGNFKTKSDVDTFALIMRDKERLLDSSEPLRFIFSHSALREGWDNPNVFQICTLNEAKSEMKKRQEIGRGLRLAVDRSGRRVFDKGVNVLTVVANESYADFAKSLQTEIEEETGVAFDDRIRNARERVRIERTKELTPKNCPEFFEIWNRIKHRTRYRVEYSTDDLVARAAKAIREEMPKTTGPKIIARTFQLNLAREGVSGVMTDSTVHTPGKSSFAIPDIYSYIQSKVNLTRRAVYRILIESGRLDEAPINPQLFLDNVVAKIRSVLNDVMVDGITYERIAGSVYEMRLFENEEIETYLSGLFNVSRPEKTLYNYVSTDSAVEREFARACEADTSIRFFFKLPRGFKIPTPIGTYNPDWAVVFQGGTRVYFIAETKSTLDPELLRGVERMKIACAKAHFALFEDEGVRYRQVREVKELYET